MHTDIFIQCTYWLLAVVVTHVLAPMGRPLHSFVREENTGHIYVCDNSQLASLLVTEIISINRFLAL